MNLDIRGKTEAIRRKVKALVFDRKNRKLSDKIYDDLGNFLEKLNGENVCIPEEYFDGLNSRMDRLEELNRDRADELRADATKDLERTVQTIEKANESLKDSYQRMGIDTPSDFQNQVDNITK